MNSDPIDWVATGAMLQGIGSLLGVVAVLLATWIGRVTWKEQKRSERKMGMAERILSATYNARTALRYIRGFIIRQSEMEIAAQYAKDNNLLANDSAKQNQRLIQAIAYENRLKSAQTEEAELRECLPMARALFGEHLEASIQKILEQFMILRRDLADYARDCEELDQKFSKELGRSMFETPSNRGTQNEMSEAIAEAVKAIESICLPALRLDAKKPKAP